MPLADMTNTRDYLTSLVDAALATIAYHAEDNPTGIHIVKTVKAAAKKKTPSVSRTIMLSDNVPQRRENGDFTNKKSMALITIHVDVEVSSRDTAGEGLLAQEYNRVQELIEYALEDNIPDSENRNARYIVSTDRVVMAGETPLFDDEAKTGSGMLVFELNYTKTRL